MNILLVNDDGYVCEGIRQLARRLSLKHTVTVVAPDGERSGSSHFVNFFSGISFKEVEAADGIRTYAVNGSPADCVAFAVHHILKGERIDLVISGINTVRNVGSDILFSGTFGAAQEGTYNRIPSVAVSLKTRGSSDFSFACEFVEKNLETFMKYSTDRVTLNVNIPSVNKEDVKGVKIAPIAYRPYTEEYVSKFVDGREVFSIDGTPIKDYPMPEGSDVPLSNAGYITISPIMLLANDMRALENMPAEEFSL